MYVKVDDFTMFEHYFKEAGRERQFTRKALQAIFNSLRRMEDDEREQQELDVIAISRDYAEESARDCAISFGISVGIGKEDDDEKDRELKRVVRKYLEDHTSIVAETDDGFVYENF